MSEAFGIFGGGTLRQSPPETVFLKAKAVAARAGITRLANVTHLDVIGIPTWVAVRPLAKSLSVSQGKGITPLLAKISALMESIEIHHAENFVRTAIRAGLQEAQADTRFLLPDSLPISAYAGTHGHGEIEWVEARSLVSEQLVYIPAELISLDFCIQNLKPHLFIGSSNGLASGSTKQEAILHGLCEVIERDQTSFWQVSRKIGARESRIDLDSIKDAAALELIGRIERAGLRIAIWDVAETIKIPCFACTVYDSAGKTVYAQRASGYGCHPLKNIALVRAITEAAQSRLTHVSGGREDVYWSRYNSDLRPDSAHNAAEFEIIARENHAVDFNSIPEVDEVQSFGQLTGWVLEKMKQHGLEDILVTDLSQEDYGIDVVHVCVPYAEQCLESRAFTPGRRMQAYFRLN